jgi:hypothetical protein
VRDARRRKAIPVATTARPRTNTSIRRKFVEWPCAWPVAGSVVTVPPPVPVATAEELADVAATVAARVAVGATVAARVAVAAAVAVPPVVLVLVPVVCAKPEPAVKAKAVRRPTTNTRSMESRLPTRAPTFLLFWLADDSDTAENIRPQNHSHCGGRSVLSSRTVSAMC